MIEAFFLFLAKLLGVIVFFVAIILVTFWIIDFCDARDRKRRDAIDRKKKLSGVTLKH
jgi:hypothetical protein